jgi:hypothetical protein
VLPRMLSTGFFTRADKWLHAVPSGPRSCNESNRNNLPYAH